MTHTPSVLKRVEQVIAALDIETKLYVFQFEHADLTALGIEQKLSVLLADSGEDFQIDTASRKITFHSSPERGKQILDLCKEWDQPVQQVYIEARILRVSLDLIRKIGATIRVNDHQANGDQKTVIDFLFPPDISASPQGLLQFGNLSFDDYTVVMQALENDSRSKLLSNPKVTVLDRQQDTFRVAVDQPSTEIVTDAESHITRDNTRFIPVGVVLTVVPVISRQGQVQMTISVEVGSLVGLSPNNIPIVDRSMAQSTVSIQDGRTLAIGGLIVDEKIETIKKVPVLGNVPLLNVFFRNKSKDNKQSELILFLTPRIVDRGTLQPPPEQLELPPSRIQLEEIKTPIGKASPTNSKKGKKSSNAKKRYYFR